MNKDLKFKGTITHILPTQSGTSKYGKEWSKTEFVVKDTAEYPQIGKFEMFNKQDVVKFLKVGNDVEVSYNLNTNEYEGKFYTSLSAWRVSSEKGNKEIENSPPVAETAQAFDNSDIDELPF